MLTKSKIKAHKSVFHVFHLYFHKRPFDFRLVLEKQEKFDGHQQFFAIVQLIGTRKQAENFAYRYVEIANKMS